MEKKILEIINTSYFKSNEKIRSEIRKIYPDVKDKMIKTLLENHVKDPVITRKMQNHS